MAAEQDEIQEQDTQEAKPSLGAALAPLDVVEVELVSVSASPLQSAGWAKLTQAGATLRVCRGDSVVRTVRPAPATQGTTATHLLQLPCSLTPARAPNPVHCAHTRADSLNRVAPGRRRESGVPHRVQTHHPTVRPPCSVRVMVVCCLPAY
jgi:hypothetical protein